MSTATLSRPAAGVDVQKHFNERRRFDYWLVVAGRNLDTPLFRKVYAKAVETGGWYSRAWQEIPAGFGFRKESTATEFAEWLRDQLGEKTVARSIQRETAPAVPVNSEPAVSKPHIERAPKSTPKPAVVNRAEKFRELADAMESTIEAKLAPMSQGWTPKRGREHASRVHDGHNLQRAQAALRALARAYDAGQVPYILLEIKTKAQVCEMMRTRGASQGYYDYRETDEFADKSPAAVALRELVDNVKSSADVEREAAERRKRDLDHAISKLRGVKIDGFFPTPVSVVARMLEAADIREGDRVLEPSAGIGSIADEINSSCPNTALIVCELRHSLVEILLLKGYATVHGDFLEEFKAGELFDKVLMNPPFERRQDEKHVRRAYELLKDGGRLVAIMTPRGSDEFEQWLAYVGAEIEALPANSFNSIESFNRTGVSTRMVVIQK